MAQQLLSRYGVVTREVAAAEGIAGGFSAVYDVLKALEDAGRVRRGYFVAGVGATQFALPPALDCCARCVKRPTTPRRSCSPPPIPPIRTAYAEMAGGLGTGDQTAGRGPTRTVGALVVLVNGALGRLHPARRTPDCRLPARRRAGALVDRARASPSACASSPATRPAAACSSPRSTAAAGRASVSRRF